MGNKKVIRGGIQVVYIFMSRVPKLLLPPDGGDPVTLPPQMEGIRLLFPPTHPPLP